MLLEVELERPGCAGIGRVVDPCGVGGRDDDERGACVDGGDAAEVETGRTGDRVRLPGLAGVSGAHHGAFGAAAHTVPSGATLKPRNDAWE